MRRAMLGGLAVLALLGSACGGDDDESSSDEPETEEKPGGPASREDYAASISTALVTMGIREEDTDCTAEVFLDVIDLEQLQAAATPSEIENGSTPPSALGIEFDDAERATFYEGVNECFDVREYFFATVSAGDQAVSDCLAGQIDDATLEHIVVSGWLGPVDPTDTSIETTMTQAYNTCVATLRPEETIP